MNELVTYIGIIITCIGIICILALFFIPIFIFKKEDDPRRGLFLYTTFVSIVTIIIGLNFVIFPNSIFTFGLCLIVCGIFLMLFDLGMTAVMCGPNLQPIMSIPIFINCILVIIYGLYFIGSATLQYLGIIL
jgi:hypothetical protein